MATLYLNSVDGSDADNGSTWALAKATITGIDGVDAAGDIIWVSDNHAESTGAAVTVALAGTVASPQRIFCGDDAAEPPTAFATSASITTTGSFGISLSGAFHMRGISLNCGTGAGAPLLALNAKTGTLQVYEQCNIRLVVTAAAARILFFADNNSTGGQLILKDSWVKFGSASQMIRLCGGRLKWNGGGIESGSSAITTLFTTPGSIIGSHTEGIIENVDFSNGATGMNLSSGLPAGTVLIFRNCKLPASWSGSPAVSMIGGARVSLINCDSGDTNYRLWIEDYYGSIKNETTLVRTGGASDGTTAYSWRMATGADAEYPYSVLKSPEIPIWNETTGSAITATVEILHDTNVAAGQGAGTANAFQDDEIWLEVQYLGDGSYPKGTEITDCKTDYFATAADQTSSSETWTTTGMTTPVKQKLSVTFTPQEKGPFIVRVIMAKASKTIYVCPKVTVS